MEPGQGRRRKEWEEGTVLAEREWSGDWFGWGEELKRKRLARGWEEAKGIDKWNAWEREIIAWEGGADRRQLFPASLPWDQLEVS